MPNAETVPSRAHLPVGIMPTFSLLMGIHVRMTRAVVLSRNRDRIEGIVPKPWVGKLPT